MKAHGGGVLQQRSRPCLALKRIAGKRISVTHCNATSATAKLARPPPAGWAPEPLSEGANSRVSAIYRRFLNTWDRGFSFNHVACPQGTWLQVVEGSVPKDLRGTFFRNGPGRFSLSRADGQQQEFGHPYDGDGLIASFAFEDGQVHFKSRFVETVEHLQEELEGRVLFRGSFATSRPGGLVANALNLYIKNNSNTSVQHWGGRLTTMFEAAPAHSLDPATLATLGHELLGGRLTPGLPVDLGAEGNLSFGSFQKLLGDNWRLPAEQLCGGGDAHTAHPHVDPFTNRLCTFTYRVTPQAGNATLMDTVFSFWEVDEKWEVVASKQWKMAGFGFMHDFALTEDYYIMVQGPVSTDQMPYMLGQVCAASSVRWQPGVPTYVHIIPRPGSAAERRGEVPQRATLDPCLFVFHFCNAYQLVALPTAQPEEAAPGAATRAPMTLVVDAVAYASLPAVGKEAAPPGGVQRAADAAFQWLEGQVGRVQSAFGGGEATARHYIDPDAGFKARLTRLELCFDAWHPPSTSLPNQLGDLQGTNGSHRGSNSDSSNDHSDGPRNNGSGASTNSSRSTLSSINGHSNTNTGSGHALKGPSRGQSTRSLPGPSSTSNSQSATVSTARVTSQVLWQTYLELPCVNPRLAGRQHRYIYGYSSVYEKACMGLAKVDVNVPENTQRFVPPEGVMLQEPTFVPRSWPSDSPGEPDEDDGWLLCQVFDTPRMASELWIFDAQALLQGPVARLAVPYTLPHMLHGDWTSAHYGPRWPGTV